MPVIDNSQIKIFQVPGMTHQTLANRDSGVSTMEVWRQTIEPGGMTPLHRHECEEVILIERGAGTVIVDGDKIEFGPDSTLILPPNVVHQIINTGDQEITLVAALGMGPVVLQTPDGEQVKRPWLVS